MHSRELGPFTVDENRGSLLEAGFPQTVVSLLEGYADSVKPDESGPINLPVVDLQVVKTAIGVLLNTSVGYGELSGN